MTNRPVNFNDPTGHMMKEDDGGSNDNYCDTHPNACGGGGSNPDLELQLSPDFEFTCADCPQSMPDDFYLHFRVGNETCDIDCQDTLQGLFVFGTIMDSIALGLNFGFALVADIAFFINPAIYAAMVIEYQGLSVIPNVISSIGGLTWIASGFVSGDNYVDVTDVNGVVNVSGSIAQDTIATMIVDGAGWLAPWAREPNGAVAIGGVGVIYDLLRNPFNPILPTFFQPAFSFSIDTNSLFH